MRSAPHVPSSRLITRALALIAVFWCSGIFARAQMPFMNAGPDSGFAQIDFAQMYLDQMNRESKVSEKQRLQNKKLIDSGVVSALDLAAPGKAVDEFNRASSLLRAQNSKEAIKHLQKAIDVYPKFVSAHVALGLAFIDQEDSGRAKSEFEAAAKLDNKFPGPFLNLGLLALSMKDFAAGQTNLEQAASLRPADAKVLSDLAYAQNGNHQYKQAVETAQRVHGLEHKGMANVHFTAASAAMSLRDYETMQRELDLFLSEDPTNAYAPIARQNLAALIRNKNTTLAAAGPGPLSAATNGSAPEHLQTFPNSDRLKGQISAVGDESETAACEECGAANGANAATSNGGGSIALNAAPNVSARAAGSWTIHTSVDQVALFFEVSSHGRTVNDLQVSDIKIRDADKAPEQILQFAPQSKLPLRLALLVDTSGSVHERFSFEKHAAARFVEKVLNPASDLGFVAGFALEPTVTEDFSADTVALGKGIDQLTEGGGTALFDAVLFTCRKLAAYPDGERVARVLVILSDGEDNSSHSTLKQSIQAAERTGVTIYAVSTAEGGGRKTDADKMLELLADRSGGEAMFPGDMMTLNKSLDKLRDVIRSRYFVAYKPAGFKPDGSYRTINIIAEKDGKRLQVRARKGYRARLESGPN